MRAALNCADLRSSYGRIEVLPGLGIAIEAGDIYALVGKNGAGANRAGSAKSDSLLSGFPA